MADQKLYGLFGKTDRQFRTHMGRVIVHPVKAELEYLFPSNKTKNGEAVVMEVPKDFPTDQLLSLREHPDLSWVKWPLNPADFRAR